MCVLLYVSVAIFANELKEHTLLQHKLILSDPKVCCFCALRGKILQCKQTRATQGRKSKAEGRETRPDSDTRLLLLLVGEHGPHWSS